MKSVLASLPKDNSHTLDTNIVDNDTFDTDIDNNDIPDTGHLAVIFLT